MSGQGIWLSNRSYRWRQLVCPKHYPTNGGLRSSPQGGSASYSGSSSVDSRHEKGLLKLQRLHDGLVGISAVVAEIFLFLSFLFALISRLAFSNQKKSSRAPTS